MTIKLFKLQSMNSFTECILHTCIYMLANSSIREILACPFWKMTYKDACSVSQLISEEENESLAKQTTIAVEKTQITFARVVIDIIPNVKSACIYSTAALSGLT